MSNNPFTKVLLSELGPELFEDSDVELLNMFYLNIITKRIYDEYFKLFGSTFQKSKMMVILNKANLDEDKSNMIFERIQYWLTVQTDMDWSTSIGLKRSRSFPNLKISLDHKSCSWPGCNNTNDLQLDHKFPYSLGGLSDIQNMQMLCPGCNLAKSASVYSINSWPHLE